MFSKHTEWHDKRNLENVGYIHFQYKRRRPQLLTNGTTFTYLVWYFTSLLIRYNTITDNQQNI